MNLDDLKNIKSVEELREATQKGWNECQELLNDMAEQFGENDKSVRAGRRILKLFENSFKEHNTPEEYSPNYLFFWDDNNQFVGEYLIHNVQYQWNPNCKINLNSINTETNIPLPYDKSALLTKAIDKTPLPLYKEFCKNKLLNWQAIPSDNLKALGIEKLTQFKKIIRHLKLKDYVGQIPCNLFPANIYICNNWINPNTQNPELLQNYKLCLKFYLNHIQLQTMDCNSWFEADLSVDISITQ